MAEPILTAARLRELVQYDPETGAFTRLIALSPRTRPGDLLGTLNVQGYLVVRVGGRQFLAHRLAFFYMTGSWPALEVDHINGKRTDNRWANLRQATTSLNQQNLRSAKTSSKTGRLGVSLCKETGRWRAAIYSKSKQVQIGRFSSIEEAEVAYLAAKRLLHEGNTL